MSNLQYIGARYVPVWYQNTEDQTANWQVNVEYEPLTFVTTINNHLYLSKKEVPDNIGNPADNTDYWLDMGVYTSGQTQHLQDEIDDINDVKLPAIISDIDDLEDAVDKRVKSLSARKFLIIGDSYATIEDNWVTEFKTKLGLSNDQVDNVAIAGQGFNVNGTKGFLGQATNYSGDKNAITDVIIAGGLNDSGITDNTGETALSSAIVECTNYIHANYPNADIYVGYIGQQLGTHSVFTYANYEGIKLAQGCYMQANRRYFYLSGVENALSVTKELFGTDQVHPNATGSQVIGDMIADAYIQGFASVSSDFKVSYVAHSSVSSLAHMPDMHVIDNRLIIEADSSILTATYAAGATVSGKVELGTFNRHIINKECSQLGYAILRNFDTAGTSKLIPCQINFYHNEISITLLDMATNNTYPTHTAATGGGTIWVLNFDMVINSPWFN